MEENWPEYIQEAKRYLTKNGLLIGAETTKSLSGTQRKRNSNGARIRNIFSRGEGKLHIS
jgi:hypothetical protein